MTYVNIHVDIKCVLNSEDEADCDGNRRRHWRCPTKVNNLPISFEPRRIQDDIEQAQALLCKLDKQKGVEDNDKKIEAASGEVLDP
ncbi:hypothetical protein FRX31_025734 [Thalictrum thalictroides]|uniref:Uncharacterized protein n=1 Tax=Thalictrum thalictroides TaxID=46969 RepID=A0A7J6VHU8_THATH|nr:hypothetical protein FRX31_025734 [Thalictrum thalictroides]